MLSLRNSNHDHHVDLYDLEGSDAGDVEIDSLTKEPLDTQLMVDEVISTTPARENDEFIKSSVDDLVLIPKESEVMERPYTIPHMPLPRQVAYSPKVVMYHYFHPRLILSDGCVLEPRRFPMIVKTTVLVFNPPITQSLIIFMIISREIL
nr:hypothetical protein CTI12_AA320170 [Tanacetum cinerariifolium]